MSLADVESYVTAFGNTLKEFDIDLDSKSSSRLLQSGVWMQDKLELKLNRQLKPLLQALEQLSRETDDSALENNLAMSTKYAKELVKMMEAMLMNYKQNETTTDLKYKWAQNLQKMKEHHTHLKNRVGIIKGMKAQEKDPRNWLPF